MLKVELDYHSTKIAAVKDPYSIVLFGLDTLEILYKIFMDEEIVKLKFSYIQDYLIV